MGLASALEPLVAFAPVAAAGLDPPQFTIAATRCSATIWMESALPRLNCSLMVDRCFISSAPHRERLAGATMRRVRMATRDELLTALTGRYQGSGREEKGRILDEFAAMTGHHRKHAMRLLRAGAEDRRARPRPHRRLYDDAVREALIVLWEASDRICGKRLKALIPTLVPAMERHAHLDLSPAIRAALLSVSAATIDRALRPQRERAGAGLRRRASPSALRRSIPVRTFSDWGDPPPGYIEADLVAHSGLTLLAPSCRRWCSPISPRAGPNARR